MGSSSKGGDRRVIKTAVPEFLPSALDVNRTIRNNVGFNKTKKLVILKHKRVKNKTLASSSK